MDLRIGTTARKLFHKEMWPNVTRVAVIEELGEENSNNRMWLSTMKKIEKEMWNQLTQKQKDWYAMKADEINAGQLALEAKAEWAYFPRSICLYDLVN